MPNINGLTNDLFKDIDFDFKLSLGIDSKSKSINLNILFASLEKNSRVFNYFKFIKHVLALFLNQLNYSLENTDLIKYIPNKKLEEIIVLLFKRYSNKISYDFISSLFTSNEIDNMINYSVNISCQLILFCEKNLRNKKFDIPSENKKLLLNKIIDILKGNKEKTKLITKLFSLLPLLLIYNEKDKKIFLEELSSILSITYEYIQSDNLDKLRISGLLCLDKLMKKIYLISTKYNINIFNENKEIQLLTLKLIFLLLNDEYSNIRKKASEIFMLFNELTNILIIPDSQLCFVNDAICQKILSKIDMNKDIYIKFAEYILENNFYFRTNIYDTKVFYMEPDNNYIDNSQNKMIILKNIIKNKLNSNKFNNLKKEQDNKIENKILIVFEEFTDNIKKICKYLLKNDENNQINDESLKYIYKNVIRNEIYQLNK